jgi:hypothetical protein
MSGIIRKLGINMEKEESIAPHIPKVRYPIAAIYKFAWPGVTRAIANA